MKVVKVVVILALVYVGIVVVFESLLGYFQPAGQSTLVITTTDDEGNTNDRVLSALQSNGQLYVAVNHWPRAWYSQVLENPQVQVALDGEKADYLAVAVEDEEHRRVDREHSLGIFIRILTGFPPRYIVRLDPR
ncbi:MAG: nitroreductase/quinone reductase family protein [Gammaproteobacteria bacterium]|nr:nitroreductase/quinone reductase family protein [Gammaproteobacteria bacterium]MCZ6658748.1 nitroreductase/quinone reductase family protein [Gammaproteobacteria bacterium]